MSGRSCVLVLIGSRTAGREWVTYEIEKGWDDAKGVVGVYIHGLKNLARQQATKGANPFANVTREGKKLSSIVAAHDPPYMTSTSVYDHIKKNLDRWVEDAIALRKTYG